VSRIDWSDDDLDRLAERIVERLAPHLPHLVEQAGAYTCATLAAELGISPRAVRAAIARGDLQAVRRGRGYVISAAAVEAWTTPARARVRASTPANVRPLRDAFKC
jgi:excisionase family DNA binding protein